MNKIFDLPAEVFYVERPLSQKLPVTNVLGAEQAFTLVSYK